LKSGDSEERGEFEITLGFQMFFKKLSSEVIHIADFCILCND